jgi:hypothetical protein
MPLDPLPPTSASHPDGAIFIWAVPELTRNPDIKPNVRVFLQVNLKGAEIRHKKLQSRHPMPIVRLTAHSSEVHVSASK